MNRRNLNEYIFYDSNITDLQIRRRRYDCTKLEGLNPLNRPRMSVVYRQLSKCDTLQYALPASKLTADHHDHAAANWSYLKVCLAVVLAVGIRDQLTEPVAPRAVSGMVSRVKGPGLDQSSCF